MTLKKDDVIYAQPIRWPLMNAEKVSVEISFIQLVIIEVFTSFRSRIDYV